VGRVVETAMINVSKVSSTLGGSPKPPLASDLRKWGLPRPLVDHGLRV
jgi:hypothetical protein